MASREARYYPPSSAGCSLSAEFAMSIELKLSRSDRVYHPGEKLEGEVVICSKGESLQHSGIRLAATGSVQLKLSEKAVGVFEALFLNVRPVPLLSEILEVGHHPSGPPCTLYWLYPGRSLRCRQKTTFVLPLPPRLSSSLARERAPPASRESRSPFRSDHRLRMLPRRSTKPITESTSTYR